MAAPAQTAAALGRGRAGGFLCWRRTMRPDGRRSALSAWPRSPSPLFACVRPCAPSRGRVTAPGCPRERDGTQRPPRPSCPSAAGAASPRKAARSYGCLRSRGGESRLAGAAAAAITSDSCKTSAGSFLPLLPAGRGRPEVTQPRARLCSLGPQPLAQLSAAHAPFPSLGKLPCSQVGVTARSRTLSTSPGVCLPPGAAQPRTPAAVTQGYLGLVLLRIQKAPGWNVPLCAPS